MKQQKARRRFVSYGAALAGGWVLGCLPKAMAATMDGKDKTMNDGRMDLSPVVTFNDGNAMPQLGLGVWRASNEEARMAVREALACGYRAVDTASIYKNEEGVGLGFRDSGLKRAEVFITTKIWNDDQGFDEAQKALSASLQRLRLDYVDLLLIHWPVPQRNRYVDTWKALIHIKKQGLVRSIGVSNFSAEQLKEIVAETGVVPVLNQIELNPFYQRHDMRIVHEQLGMLTEGWSPLAQGRVLNDPRIAAIAEKHGKTPVQIVVRWHLDSGIIVIPKSVTPSRIRSNFQVFDFTLDAEDMAAMAALDAT